MIIQKDNLLKESKGIEEEEGGRIQVVQKTLKWLQTNNLVNEFRRIVECWDFYYTSKTTEIFRLEYSTRLRINDFFKVKQSILRELQKSEEAAK